MESFLAFNLNKGHRFDFKNHNWILFYEYISLSFSFMTFVIRAKSRSSDEVNLKSQIFDVEQYHFLLNRKTCFHCDEFVENDYEKLEYVLSNLERIDPVLI